MAVKNGHLWLCAWESYKRITQATRQITDELSSGGLKAICRSVCDQRVSRVNLECVHNLL